jgi:hypothetical protein
LIIFGILEEAGDDIPKRRRSKRSGPSVEAYDHDGRASDSRQEAGGE